MKKAILFASVALVAATSCNPWQGEIDQANKTSDSLRTVLAEERQISQQMSDLFEEVNANMKQIKEVERARISEYAARVEGATFTPGCKGIWTIPCDIAIPCATQNELDIDGAKALVANGCFAVTEGANMPCTAEAIEYIQSSGLLFAPAKAANAGGVATSALEMSQNSMRYSWTFEEVDAKLKGILENIYANASAAAKEYGMEGNLVAGANIAGFLKVAEAMIAQGVV